MKSQLLKALENSRQYTLAVAAAMPEKQYHYKPVPDAFSFKELMTHIGYGIHWWEENTIRSQESAWEPPAAKKKTEAIQYLDEAYQHLQQSIQQHEATPALVDAFHNTLSHITHHRGQAVTYLRSNGITPPEYAY
ncbi:DinB family protein [Chitinophaga vietnamensis]|uniref:DinB family protein n=1 Tax=Chitinophaga vietnamensis TaxID=2593957 RepID=UPI001178B3A3|nr:DinB family protein [Chitinophaga vietnamensis]